MRHYPKTSSIPFNAFFSAGQDERLSPFLSAHARKWAVGLPLKAAIIAAFLLIFAYAAFYWYESENLAYLLLIFVYFLAGIPALIESLEDLFSFQINIDVLMTLAAFGSILIGSPLEGALLLVLFSLSGAMEDSVTARAKDSIRSLHELTPSFANVLDENGVSTEKALSDIKRGTHILVKSGEMVPLDGKVLEGISSVNLMHLTGESLPITKKPGDNVPAGAQNLEGSIIISVTHTSQDSTLARIIQLVTNAQDSKPKLQRWFDNLSETYAKGIIFLATLIAISLPFLIQIPFLGNEGSIYRSLAFLIAASPCALIIAIPIAYLSAIGACARSGIILKGGVILDALGSCKAIAFDKTGTLTTGELSCIGFEPLHESKIPSNILDIALALEQKASHPIAKALATYSLKEGASPAHLTHYKSIPGFGLEAKANDEAVFIGNFEFIEPKLQINDQTLLKKRYETLSEQGDILAFLIVGKDPYIFRFQDKMRPEAPAALIRLRKEGYRLMMLTGDHQFSANRIANLLNIDEVHAHLKPEDKLQVVTEISEKMSLAMVGDGVNDAPALARATVGISMGKVGSSAAIDAADVVLLQDNIENLDWLMKKAKATQVVVRQNLFIATAAIFIASIPALLGLLPLWLAVILHEGGTVIVGLNGLRLLGAKKIH